MIGRRKTAEPATTTQDLERLARDLRADLERLARPRGVQPEGGRPANVIHKRLAREESAAAAIIVALMLPAIVGCLALVCDAGMRALAEVRAGQSADAGALGAGYGCLHDLGRDDALAAATTYVELNGAELEAVVLESCAAQGDPAISLVKVTASATFPTFLGGTGEVQRSATASWSSGHLELTQ